MRLRPENKKEKHVFLLSGVSPSVSGLSGLFDLYRTRRCQVIKPQDEFRSFASRGAFVELVARAPQPVEFFVTHFFGQSAKDRV